MSYDVVIVGGGVAGLTLACALAKFTSLSIAILEKHEKTNWDDAHYHHRVSALTLASQRIFKNLQLWEKISIKRLSPFTQIQVWNQDGKGEIVFGSPEASIPVLGYIVENNAMQQVLEEAVLQFPQIKLHRKINLTHFEKMQEGVKLIAQNGEHFQAKLAVAADGAHSWLRQQAGITVKEHSYQEEALVCTVQTALPHQTIARQVFLEDSVLAFLPLADEHYSSIVWSLPTAVAKQYQQMDEALFKVLLAEKFAHRLGTILHTDQRYLFPLRKQAAHHYIAENIALIGDAAHTIHPLAGQGINMGLLDAASLAETITEAWRLGQAFSAYTHLRRYERFRKADNSYLLYGVDCIKNIFASKQKINQLFCSFGLNVLNHSGMIKNQITKFAIGNRSNLPKLATERYTPTF